MSRHAARTTVTIIAAALATAVGCVPAYAATATQQITGGALEFIATPGDVTFGSVALNGADQTQTQTQAFGIRDATGSGSGWNITATSTTFTSGGDTLPTTATTIQSAPAIACNGGSGCTLPADVDNTVSYPYTLPAAGSAPTATKMFSADASSGLGEQNVTPTWTLAIPAATAVGTYTSTWTFTLVSGP